MEKEFIPYEIALALKELGFDEPCFGFWTSKDNYQRFINDSSTNKDLENMFEEEAKKTPTAPLYQQAFRWFRKKYRLSGEPQSHQFYFSYYIIYDTLGENKCKSNEHGFESYEEAELECLKKLIEIVKEKDEKTRT